MNAMQLNGTTAFSLAKGTRLNSAEELEAALRQIGLGVELVIERDDKRAADLHYREYVANRDGQTWRILAATVNGPKGGQAMLTAGR